MIKVDLLLDWEFTCKACGHDCILSLPMTDDELVIKMPACPLDNASVPRHLLMKLDDTSPTNGILTQIHGHVYVTDENMDDIIADIAISILLK